MSCRPHTDSKPVVLTVLGLVPFVPSYVAGLTLGMVSVTILVELSQGFIHFATVTNLHSRSLPIESMYVAVICVMLRPLVVVSTLPCNALLVPRSDIAPR